MILTCQKYIFIMRNKHLNKYHVYVRCKETTTTTTTTTTPTPTTPAATTPTTPAPTNPVTA